jgi:hypothetical protein
MRAMKANRRTITIGAAHEKKWVKNTGKNAGEMELNLCRTTLSFWRVFGGLAVWFYEFFLRAG